VLTTISQDIVRGDIAALIAVFIIGAVTLAGEQVSAVFNAIAEAKSDAIGDDV
jgi:Flp pilus assembly pilin Flp